MDRVIIFSDAGYPQVNGVVNTLKNVYKFAVANGFDCKIITPRDIKTRFEIPFYREIELAFPSQTEIDKYILDFKPNYIHIATEGPIGIAAKKWCIKNKNKFTTSYHTKFPEFIEAQFKIPAYITRWWFRKFHNSGNGVFVATKSLQNELNSKGFKNIIPWTRGVDTDLFKPIKRPKNTIPVYIYVGRVSKEKNIEVFLNMQTADKKVVIGDGPMLNYYMKKYSYVTFKGTLTGENLAREYAMSDYFVFPSKTDTFGIVILEALASGLPVIAYPVTGPVDIIENHKTGYLSNELELALWQAKYCKQEDCVNEAKKYSWAVTARQFYSSLIKA